jgi:hypothetical protein
MGKGEMIVQMEFFFLYVKVQKTKVVQLKSQFSKRRSLHRWHYRK